MIATKHRVGPRDEIISADFVVVEDDSSWQAVGVLIMVFSAGMLILGGCYLVDCLLRAG